jgi:hypothetical protein
MELRFVMEHTSIETKDANEEIIRHIIKEFKNNDCIKKNQQ